MSKNEGPADRGNSAGYGGHGYSNPVHGTDSEGNEVTAAFGNENAPTAGHTLLSDGHKSDADFSGTDGQKGHDHYDGKGGGTSRGQYTGEGS